MASGIRQSELHTDVLSEEFPISSSEFDYDATDVESTTNRGTTTTALVVFGGFGIHFSHARSATRNQPVSVDERPSSQTRARYSRGFRTRFVNVPYELNVNAEDVQILGASLVAGLYPKVISMDPSGGLKTIINQQPVSIVSRLPSFAHT